jgi:uncharacterized protein YbjT (DUF2867 family)
VIHFSAVGVDRGARSSFSASKAAGDADLQARDLDWVILRPSVVSGDESTERAVFSAAWRHCRSHRSPRTPAPSRWSSLTTSSRPSAVC